MKQHLLIFVFLIPAFGCMSVMVEEDGVQIGSRDTLAMLNPAGHALSDATLITEVILEKPVSESDTSLFTIGYGRDKSDDKDASAIYILTSGRYYWGGKAPQGFYINGDVGFGQYQYKLTDHNGFRIMYGVAGGYKFIWGAFALDLGAGTLNMHFDEHEPELTPVLRVLGGIKF